MRPTRPAAFPRLAFLLTLIAAPLSAADGRIPISSLPYTISAPGTYYLTRPLTLASGTAINIASNQVTLDLGGQTLSVGATTVGNYVIYSGNPGYSGVRVTNGNLAGGNSAIFFYTSTGGEYQLDHLDVTGTGSGAAIGLGSNSGSSPATHAVLESIRVFTCGGIGISVQNVMGGRITGSSVRGCTYGLQLSVSHGVLVDGNTLADNTLNGMVLSNNGPAETCRDNILSNNIVKQNGGAGILLNIAHGNRITGNVIGENAGGGISLVSSTFNDVSRNTIAANTGDGIRLGSTSRFNAFDWNTASGNTLAGMTVSDAPSTGNIYSYNRFAGNTAANNFNSGNISAGGNNAGAANF